MNFFISLVPSSSFSPLRVHTSSILFPHYNIFISLVPPHTHPGARSQSTIQRRSFKHIVGKKPTPVQVRAKESISLC
jgi:hypothetical protein